MFEKRVSGTIVYYTSALLEKNGFKNAFCTKYGGVSKGCFESLNVSFNRKDENGCTDTRENVVENYRRALFVVGSTPENAVGAKQVHENTVRTASENDAGLEILRESDTGYDGVVVGAENRNINAACVKTADCVPVLLANIRTGDICAVHAGWRGTVSDIVTNAVRKLSDNPSDIAAAIGPCIGPCCYEVGNEVYEAVKSLFEIKGISHLAPMMFLNAGMCSISDKKHANLALVNRTLLECAGVSPENIEVSNICTCCTVEKGEKPFFSHRASGGHSGTFLSVISKR